MDLGGVWQATEADDLLRRSLPDVGLDDAGWDPVTVPGHWRSSGAFAASDGPLFYRRRFDASASPGRRSWLQFDGVFYQGDVWLDGSYLGDTEGYFFPHAFEVTEALAAQREHVLAVEVACTPPLERTAKRNLTGIFQHWDCIDPDWNPGGIWAPVRLVETGPVRISTLRVLCRDARSEQASLDLDLEMDALEAAAATITTVLRRDPDGAEVLRHTTVERLAAGPNRARWRVTLERPDLWWPHALGEQPLYRVEVDVSVPAGDGGERDGDAPPLVRSDHRTLVTGLRQVRMRDFVATVNGERLFLKGANYGPTRRELAEVTDAQVSADVDLARSAGLDLLRVHAHIGHPRLYEVADRAGMLLWQDLPLQWGYARVRRQAVRQGRQAVATLGHHPSLAVWCAHNEPLALDVAPGSTVSRRDAGRFMAGQMLPSWNKTALDRSIKRALEKADHSRPVVAHSGVLPHPAGGTDSHLYFGWYHGDERGLPALLGRLPIMARFVGEFGAQAVPEHAGFMHPDAWPDLDWERLERHYALQKQIFDRRVPPDRYATFDGWRRATQTYQADLLRFHVETLRRLKYRPTGGFCQFLFADAQPAVTWSVLDHERAPKLGYRALAAACAPVIVVAERPAEHYAPGERIRLAVHVVSDRRVTLGEARVAATMSWPGGRRAWTFAGPVPADSCVQVGRVDVAVPGGTEAGPWQLELRLTWSEADGPDQQAVTNRYESRIE